MKKILGRGPTTKTHQTMKMHEELIEEQISKISQVFELMPVSTDKHTFTHKQRCQVK